MHIWVMDVSTQVFQLVVESTDTILVVKQKIQDLWNVPMDQQTLFDNNNLLVDDRTLVDLGITNGATVHLIMCPDRGYDVFTSVRSQL
jgi:uncharacterized ubiquitin-like protein YukD